MENRQGMLLGKEYTKKYHNLVSFVLSPEEENCGPTIFSTIPVQHTDVKRSNSWPQHLNNNSIQILSENIDCHNSIKAIRA
jgi:hypothetical protein